MDFEKLETLPPPPGVFGSLKAGFDIVSSRVALILIPLALDLLLWLGPRLSVEGLLLPSVNFLFESYLVRQNLTGTSLEVFTQNQEILLDRLQDFNLISLLSKSYWFPVGIDSLSAQSLPVTNPLGLQNVVVVSSIWILLGLMAMLIPLGWVIGGVFFRQISGSIQGEDEAGVGVLRSLVQTVFLSMFLVLFLMALVIPVLFILVVIYSLSPLIANTAVLVISFFSFWLIVPLYFTPYGIFVRKQNALNSILSSLRMIRFSLPTSGMFVLSVFILSRGLDQLWRAPKSESWLALVGFAGHAFVTTALVTASFVYYRDMGDWLQTVYDRFKDINKKPSSKV